MLEAQQKLLLSILIVKDCLRLKWELLGENSLKRKDSIQYTIANFSNIRQTIVFFSREL